MESIHNFLYLFVGFLSLLPLASSIPRNERHSKAVIIPNKIYDGSAENTLESTVSTTLDGVKVKHTNATSYEWWYGDVVSNTPQCPNCSVVIVFYSAAPGGFIGVADQPSSLVVSLQATFANGSQFSVEAVAPKQATVIEEEGGGSAGCWEDSGFSWKGSADNKRHIITIDAIGVKGTVVLDSVAPPHYPCGPNASGQDLHFCPSGGWANAVPDSDASVSLTFADESHLAFDGFGYRDKNWGVRPFTEGLTYEYWGHARVGPYSIVYAITALQGDAKIFRAIGFVSKHGKPLLTTCRPGSAVKVRPTGHNDDFPPTKTSGLPGGYHIEFELGKGRGVLEVDLTDLLVITKLTGYYGQFSGKACGRIVKDGYKSETFEGYAIAEQFTP